MIYLSERWIHIDIDIVIYIQYQQEYYVISGTLTVSSVPLYELKETEETEKNDKMSWGTGPAAQHWSRKQCAHRAY